MPSNQYSDAVWRAWIVHHALSGLGFKSDDVFVEVCGNAEQPTTGLWAWVVLRTQDKKFTHGVGPVDGDAFHAEWLRFVADLKSIPEAELGKHWDDRDALMHYHGWSVALVEGLLRKGFTFPYVHRRMN